VAGLQFNRDLVDIVRWSRDSFIASITFRIPCNVIEDLSEKNRCVNERPDNMCVNECPANTCVFFFKISII
jgi:hypothetical protein